MSTNRAEFQKLCKDLLQKTIFDDAMTCDWQRQSFKLETVADLELCVTRMRAFALAFTRKDDVELDRQITNLIYSIHSNVRLRPVFEQHPALSATLETLETLAVRFGKVEGTSATIQGWQHGFDSHLEGVFTMTALKHLRQHQPNNNYVDIFGTNSDITRTWNYPSIFSPPLVFELDGLIHDTTNNIMYIIEAKFSLDDEELEKCKKTYSKFESFLSLDRLDRTAMEKTAVTRSFFRHQEAFYGPYGLLNAKPELKLFLGFNNVKSATIVKQARAQGYQLIGPSGRYYRVYEASDTDAMIHQQSGAASHALEV